MIKAKFSNKTKEVIAERDWYVCIICWEPWNTVHHAFYGMQSNRWPDRNNENQWVILDYNCHHNLHNWINWKELREQCITYLQNYYDIKL